MQKSVRVLRFSLKCIRQCPCRILQAAAAPTYLDANGNLIKKKNLSKQAKQLLHDYQLIQYDMSVGKNYLKDTGFVDLPEWPVYNRVRITAAMGKAVWL